ncbi:MAG: hypothetical protein ACYTG4_04890, partial [Planctomycetota bacterium]
MTRTITSLLAGALVLVGLAADAAAATITVGKNGIETIQDALNVAEDFDTIVIPKGTWDIQDLLLENAEGITIKGKGKPVLDATQSEAIVCLVLDNCSDITVVGLTFRGASR